MLEENPEEFRAYRREVQRKTRKKKMKIADRKGIKTTAYYKLVGAESEYGIPYSFIKEWLIQL